MMWAKKPKSADFVSLNIPAPRVLNREQRSMELVLRYVERMLVHPMSMLDAEVLLTLIKAAQEGGGEHESVRVDCTASESGG